jgi:putative SOS response-associated peptidase YedK
MCGRFALVEHAQYLTGFFGCFESQAAGFSPSFNVAPTQSSLIIRQVDGVREAAVARWGLVPSWADDSDIGNRMINARGETVQEKPAFRSAFASRRCVVPVTAFYEWESTSQGKQPYAFMSSGDGILALAGLWERWEKGLEVLETFAILTTSANALLGRIHDRMPVILNASGISSWLDVECGTAELAALMVPSADDELRTHAVSRKVNSPLNTSADLLDPVVDRLF